MPTIKIQLNDDIRRLSFPSSITLEELNKQILSLFALPQHQETSLKYFDGEDNCLISSNEELDEALAVSAERKCILKILVTLKEKARKKKSAESYFHNEDPIFPCLNLIQQFFYYFVCLFRRFSCRLNSLRENSPRRLRKLKMAAIALFFFLILFHPRLVAKPLLFAAAPFFLLVALVFILIALLLLLFPLVKILSKLLSAAKEPFQEFRTRVCTMDNLKKEEPKKEQQPKPEEKKSYTNIELLQMYNYELQHLWEMGFVNSFRNLELLHAHSGDLDATLVQLLSEM